MLFLWFHSSLELKFVTLSFYPCWGLSISLMKYFFFMLYRLKLVLCWLYRTLRTCITILIPPRWLEGSIWTNFILSPGCFFPTWGLSSDVLKKWWTKNSHFNLSVVVASPYSEYKIISENHAAFSSDNSFLEDWCAQNVSSIPRSLEPFTWKVWQQWMAK